MIIKKNVLLKKLSTLKIGGECNYLYYPENTNELIDLCKKIDDLRIIGGGSNILINDEKSFANVCCTRKMKMIEVVNENEGIFRVDCGVSPKQLVAFLKKRNFGGIEYLANVPCTIGGAVRGNAGQWLGGDVIGNYVISVNIFDRSSMKTIRINHSELEYGHRSSIFKSKPEWIILSVNMKFFRKTEREIERDILNKKKFVREWQDTKKPNLGSVFSTGNRVIFFIFRKIYKFNHGVEVIWSSKTSNWFVNNGKGTFKGAKKSIKTMEIVHKIFFQKIEREIEIWE